LAAWSLMTLATPTAWRALFPTGPTRLKTLWAGSERWADICRPRLWLWSLQKRDRKNCLTVTPRAIINDLSR